MHFQTLLSAMLALASATMTLASPCHKKGRQDKLEPFSLPGDCGEDAWWDSEKLECHCKGKGAIWNARKKRCDCINPDTEWIKGMSTCKCRSRQKDLNKKGECVCITDPMSLWFQDFGRLNDCPVSDPASFQHERWQRVVDFSLPTNGDGKKIKADMEAEASI
jgi:hypothetical protein